jgi:hypothetical protein
VFAATDTSTEAATEAATAAATQGQPGAERAPADLATEELARLLSRERLLLELLLFKLVTLRQLLASGEVRFMSWASDEVERAIEKVRKAELARALAVSELAAATARSEADFTLARLIETAPEPWTSIFADHRQGFGRLTAEINEALAATRRLASAGSGAVTDMLDRLSGGAPEPQFAGAATYGPGAQWETTAPAARWSTRL